MLNTSEFKFKPVKWNDEVLAKPATFLNNTNAEVVEELRKYVKKFNLEAISAPQLGIPANIFVIKDFTNNIQTFYNARIVEKSGSVLRYREGCINLPGVDIVVARHEKVKVRFKTEDGSMNTKEFSGVEARLIQMMVDTVSGVPITERLTFSEKARFQRKLIQFDRKNR